jgi:hypothetical protein
VVGKVSNWVEWTSRQPNGDNTEPQEDVLQLKKDIKEGKLESKLLIP